MIVQINENNSDKYRKLFIDAYEFLEDLDNGSVIKGKGRFSNLADYYGHIADLFNQQKYEYIMVPLDEEPFNINLNTRTITVPAAFSKCASVQTDTLAETIIFISDRYFDYMDLANTEIYVQWTTPNGFKGATRVEMRDLNSEPGKIKFAWPLNSVITEVPGVVKFSVRFFRINDNKQLVYSLNTLDADITIKPVLQPEGPSGIESPIHDNLFKNAVINSNYAATGIEPPIQPTFAAPGTDLGVLKENSIIPVPTETDSIGYMKMFDMTEDKFKSGTYWIKNKDSYIKAVNFDENEIYYIQIQKGIKYIGLNNDNTLTLYAQAVAADEGEITYKWYYRAQDGEYNDKYYDCENYPSGNFGIVNHNTFINVGKNPTYNLQDRYYEQDINGNYIDNVTGVAYKEYNDIFPAENDLYERFTSLTIPADSVENPIAVTGLYYVAAENTKDVSGYSKVDDLTEDRYNTGVYYIKDENGNYELATEFENNKIYYVKIESGSKQGLLTTPFATESTMCLLPGPNPIQITKDLNNSAVFNEKEIITLNIAISEDDYNPEITYAWKMSSDSIDNTFDKNNVILSRDNYYSIPGYIFAEEVKNQETFNQGTYYVKNNGVYEKATEYIENTVYYTENAGWYGVAINSKLNRKNEENFSNIIKVTHNPIPPQVKLITDVEDLFGKLTNVDSTVTFKVELDETYLDINNLLKSEGLEYQWQMSLPDQGWQNIDNTENGITIEENTLTVSGLFTHIYASFRCIVINTLNGKKAVFDHTGDLDVIEGETIGIFKKEPPYIFDNSQSFEFVISKQF